MKHGCLTLIIFIILGASGCAQQQTEAPTLPSTPDVTLPAETPVHTDISPTPIPTPEKPAVQSTKVIKSGHVTEDEIWSGTIRVTGDIWVAEDATLTITPGTTVLVSAGKDDQNRGSAMILDESEKEKIGPICTEEYDKSHILIKGRIIAVGTPNETVVFTSDSTKPGYADWSGILLHPGSRIEYSVVEYAGRVGIGVQSDIPQDDSVLVSNNIIRHIFMGGVSLGGTTCARVISNEVSDCGSEGINVDPGGGAPYIAYNTVKYSTVGIATLPESFAIIENNVLIDNVKGIVTRAKDTIRHNHISFILFSVNGWVLVDRNTLLVTGLFGLGLKRNK